MEPPPLPAPVAGVTAAAREPAGAGVMAGATTGAAAANSSRMVLLSAVWRWDQVLLPRVPIKR